MVTSVLIALLVFICVASGKSTRQGAASLNFTKSICSPHRSTTRAVQRRDALESRYREQSRWNYDPSVGNKITLLFGHVHHAGGTAFCELARNNTIANPKDNCNHPLEFKAPPSAPTSGHIAEQLEFQRSSPWLFVSVELKMPQHFKLNGPFIYGVVLRNPYLLLMSQHRRSKVKFQFKGDLIDLVHFQLKYVGVTTVDYRQHMIHYREKQQGATTSQARNATPVNYFRGQAAFLLGRFGPTDLSDSTIFNMAKRRLQRFSVVALTEFMVESGEVFGAKLNWKVGDFGKSAVNSNGDASGLVTALHALGQQDQAFVRYYCGVDAKLYEYATCLLQREYHGLTNKSLSAYPYKELDSFFSSKRVAHSRRREGPETRGLT